MKTVKELVESKDKTVWSITPKAKVFDALKLMAEKEIGALMVMNEKGDVCAEKKFVGIISIGDVVKSIISEKEILIEQLSNYIAGKYL